MRSFPVESPEHGPDRNARSPHSALKGLFGQPQAVWAPPTEPGIRSAVARVLRLKGVEVTAQGKTAPRSPPWVRPPTARVFRLKGVENVAHRRSLRPSDGMVVSATGKEVWNKPKVGKYHAALLKTADGKLLMHDDGGALRMLAPNVKEYEELAVSKACGTTWAHPAIANGKIYVRDEKEVICLELPPAATPAKKAAVDD